MYNPGKYRFYSVTLLIVVIVALLLLSGIIWNKYLESEKMFSITWLVVMLLIVTGAASGIFIIAYHLTDQKIFNNHLENIIKNERMKLLKEFEEKREKEKVIQTEETGIEELIIDILPDNKGIKTIEEFAGKLMSNIATKFEMLQGLCYLHNKEGFKVIAQYAFTGEHTPDVFIPGETIPGQAAKDQEVMIIGEIPEDYFQIKSGLGGSLPKYIVFIPLIYKNKTIALFELASFRQIDDKNINIFKELSGILGERFAKFIK